MNFKLIKKDYKDEDYEASFTWNDIPLKAIVRMHYHTFLHWWGASYYIQYGRNNVTPVIKGEQYLDRKKARELAKQYMKEASPKDVDKLDKFYQGGILSSVLK